MQRKTRNRLLLILGCLFLAALGTYIILHNLKQNIVFFYPPSKINEAPLNKQFRVGGLVKKGSIVKIDLETIRFIITDNETEMKVVYRGILPALFREGQGIVAEGKLQGDSFVAGHLLTKHDENYRPPGE